MAKATAKCTCRMCKKGFVKETTKFSRKEANAWEIWAERHYDLCPACWGMDQRRQEMAKPLRASVELNPSHLNFVILLSGNTYDNKDAIRKLGFEWGYPLTEPAELFGNPKMSWHKNLKFAEVDNVFKDLKSIGAEVLNKISKIDKFMYEEAQNKAESLEAEDKNK